MHFVVEKRQPFLITMHKCDHFAAAALCPNLCQKKHQQKGGFFNRIQTRFSDGIPRKFCGQFFNTPPVSIQKANRFPGTG